MDAPRVGRDRTLGIRTLGDLELASRTDLLELERAVQAQQVDVLEVADRTNRGDVLPRVLDRREPGEQELVDEGRQQVADVVGRESRLEHRAEATARKAVAAGVVVGLRRLEEHLADAHVSLGLVGRLEHAGVVHLLDVGEPALESKGGLHHLAGIDFRLRNVDADPAAAHPQLGQLHPLREGLAGLPLGLQLGLQHFGRTGRMIVRRCAVATLGLDDGLFHGTGRRGFHLVGGRDVGVVRHIGIPIRLGGDSRGRLGVRTHQHNRGFAKRGTPNYGNRTVELAAVDGHGLPGRHVLDAARVRTDGRLEPHPLAGEGDHLLGRVAFTDQLAGDDELLAVVDDPGGLPEHRVDAGVVAPENRDALPAVVHAG